MANKIDLEGRVAVITGGAQGFGRAATERFIASGAKVAIWDRDAALAEKTAAELGSSVKPFAVDVTDPKSVEKARDATIRAFGRIDILVNNAARTFFVPVKKIEDVTDEMWEKIFALNVRGVFLACRAAKPYMGDPSHIINIGSTAGVNGDGSSIPYAASKGALHLMTIPLARALAPTRVNCIAPGFMDTRWLRGGFGDRFDVLKDDVVRGTPVGYAAYPEDVASMVVALARGGDFVSGQVLVVDGGSTIGTA